MASHPPTRDQSTHEDQSALTRALWCLLFMYYLLAIYFGVNVVLALKGDSSVSLWVSTPLMLVCVACAYICARIVDHRNLCTHRRSGMEPHHGYD